MADGHGSSSSPAAGRTLLPWLVLLTALCLWVAWRLGAFALTASIELQGQRLDVADAFATVDHPFHAARADALLQSLREGELLRWIGNHQGGYPAEYYPLGIAWLDLALWALLLGAVPVVAVHKLAVIVVFLLPAWTFWLLARGDRLHPGTAFLATAIHLAVPGHWLNGGYTELVGWGLVTNVAGGSLALAATGALARYAFYRERGMAVLAVLMAAGGAVSNPRSLFAIVIAAIAVMTCAVISEARGWRALVARAVAIRVALVGLIAGLLAAPVIVPLVRYQEHYFFLHYEAYEPLSEYVTAMATAVTPVVMLLAAGAVVLAWRARLPLLRVLSLTLVGYMLFTMWVATSRWAPPLVEQLEAPRLMPFQRQVMIYLAAALIVQLVERAATRCPLPARSAVRGGAIVALALLVMVAFVRPIAAVPEKLRGQPARNDVPETHQSLSPVSTTGVDEFAEFLEAIRAADSLRPPGTSIFVIGNRPDWWHEQLWAPIATDAPLYYDDWLWYWTTTHQGPYDYRNGHYFPNPSLALTSEYLRGNGIGAVVVTDMWVPQGVPPRQAARSSPFLAHSTTVGAWDVYAVRQPTSLVTRGEAQPIDISIGNQEIQARLEDGAGAIVVRRNWFPRWEATVNGSPAAITPRADGYMQIDAPPGPVDLELRYAVTGVDWLARLASLLGFAGLVALLWFGPRAEAWLIDGRSTVRMPQ